MQEMHAAAAEGAATLLTLGPTPKRRKAKSELTTTLSS